jgi:PKD repeat protein
VAVNANFSNPTQSLVTTLTLQLTSTNNLCLSSTVVPVLQNIYPPVAAIAGGGSLTCQTGTVMLTNQSSSGIPAGVFSSTAPVVGFLWEGPSPQLPLSLSSTYVAYTPGTYTLTAVDNNNGCSDQATKNVANIGPVAAFTHTVLNGVASFSDVSNGIGPGTSYFWKFGDGATSTARHPSHTYQNAGSHLVKFFVTNSQCIDSVIQSVNITGLPCTANSGFTLLPTGTSQVWLAVPAYPYNVSAARWDWGDNSSSNTLYTSHQYSAAGLYNICLSVTVNCVASSSTCTSYSVYRSSMQAGIIQVNVVSPEVVAGLRQFPAEEEIPWTIAPNPGNGLFCLEMRDLAGQPVHLTIHDLTGRAVYAQILDDQGTRHHIDITGLASGVFILTLEKGEARQSRRLIIQH